MLEQMFRVKGSKEWQLFRLRLDKHPLKKEIQLEECKQIGTILLPKQVLKKTKINLYFLQKELKIFYLQISTL